VTRSPLSVLLALVLVVGFMIGCATPAQPTATPQPPAPAAAAPKPTAAPTAMPAATTAGIVVTDITGRKVELPKPPERIVIAGQGAYIVLHNLFMFPAAKQKVVAHELRQANNAAFIQLIDPTFKDKGVLEMNAGPEQIATFKPDLVIIKSTADVKLAAGLEQLKIPVLYVGLETPEMIEKDISNLGVVLGEEAKAKEINAFFKSRIDRIRDRTKDVDEKSKPKVLTVDYKDRSGQVAVSVAPAAWMQTIQVQMAGGTPVWVEAASGGSGWIVVNMEQVAKWNPDRVYVISFLNPNPGEVIAKLKADPQWKELKAVKSDQLYAYPQEIFAWDTPDARWVLGSTWLAKQFYPDRFKDVDLTQEVTTFFTQVYGMDKAAVEKEILPKLKTDVH
jgi:iron complex transport system substrate-binding protein